MFRAGISTICRLSFHKIDIKILSSRRLLWSLHIYHNNSMMQIIMAQSYCLAPHPHIAFSNSTIPSPCLFSWNCLDSRSSSEHLIQYKPPRPQATTWFVQHQAIWFKTRILANFSPKSENNIWESDLNLLHSEVEYHYATYGATKPYITTSTIFWQ